MKSIHLPMRKPGRPAAAGFTLTELMIVVVIVSLLLAIAVPSYQSQVRKSRRTEARTALLDLATREERWFSANNAYTNAAANLGYSTLTPVGSGYYNVAIVPVAANPAAAPPTQAGYTITATPIGIQTGDADCQTFTVDQTGTQTSAPKPAATCWQ